MNIPSVRRPPQLALLALRSRTLGPDRSLTTLGIALGFDLRLALRVALGFALRASRIALLALRSRPFEPDRSLTTLRIALRLALRLALRVALGIALGGVGRLRLLGGPLVLRIGYRTPVHGLYLRVRTYGVLPDGPPGTGLLWRTLLPLRWTPQWVLPRRVLRLGGLRAGVLRFGGLRLGGFVERGDLLAGRFRWLPLIMRLWVGRSALLRGLLMLGL